MPSTINNQAEASYRFSGSSVVNNISSNINSVTLNDLGLTISKTASPSEFVAGSIIDYTVTITNNSSSYLSGVRIIDNLGGGNLAYVVGSGRLSTLGTNYPVSPVATNPLTFTLQQLNVGQSMTLTYKSQVIFNLPSSVTSITNTVNGIGYTSTGTINGSDSETIQKKNNDSVEITKTSSASSVNPNQSFDYILTLTNTSSTLARIPSVTDQLPSNFTLTSVSLKTGSGSTTTLNPSDYTLSGSNLLTIPSTATPLVNVPGNSSRVITITGYLS